MLERFAELDGFSLEWMAALARRKGVELLSREQRGSRDYAHSVLPLIQTDSPAPKPRQPSEHSDAIVIIDRAGNVAALVHSINTMLWGTTGIVVGGIPLPDPAGQLRRLARFSPGALVPNEMSPVIVNTAGKPTLAIATVGAALLPETVRILLGTLGNRREPVEVMAAPPLLLNYDYSKRGMVQVPEGRYDEAFLTAARGAGLTLQMQSRQGLQGKGTAVIGFIDPDTGIRRSVEVVQIFGFATGY